jgi:hypothetical protein
LNLAAAAVKVTQDVTLIIFRSGGFHGHDRLKQMHLAFFSASLTAKIAAILKAFSLESTSWLDPSKKVDVHVDHRIAGDDAIEGGFLAASLAGVDEFLRNRPTDNLVFDDDALAALAGAILMMT